MASARKRSLFAAGAAQIAFATGGVRAVQRTRASASGTEKDERSKKQKKNMSQLLHEPVKALTSEEKKRRAKVASAYLVPCLPFAIAFASCCLHADHPSLHLHHAFMIV